MDELKNIELDKIYPNPNQPRKLFDAASLSELAQSICRVGLLSPLLVRQTKEGYMLIAGERRWRACKMCRIEKVPCIVCDYDDERAALASITENIQRKDLNPFEQAYALRELISAFSLTQAQAAERLGKSQSAIANKLRLLSLPDEVQKLIVRENLTERHARELLRLPQNKQQNAALHIIKHSLNVEQTASYIDSLIKPRHKKERVYVFKDIRLFTNTIDRSVMYLRKAGVQAFSEKQEDEKSIRYLITIPKKSG